MKSGVKNIVSLGSRCLMVVSISLLLANCGDDKIADASFDNYLATGEMKLSGAGALGGGSKCEQRVQVDQVCGSKMLNKEDGDTREAAEAATLAKCEEMRMIEQNSVRQLADQEKANCEADNNDDGNKDCDFWTSEQFPPCVLDTTIHYIDGGGDNPDTFCQYPPGSNEGTCMAAGPQYTDHTYWMGWVETAPPCIKVSCKI